MSKDAAELFKWASRFAVLPYFNKDLQRFVPSKLYFYSLFITITTANVIYLYEFGVLGRTTLTFFNLVCMLHQEYYIFDVHISKLTTLSALYEDFLKIDTLLKPGESECKTMKYTSCKYVGINLAINLLWFGTLWGRFAVGHNLRFYPLIFARSHYILNDTLLQYFLIQCICFRIKLLNKRVDDLKLKKPSLGKQSLAKACNLIYNAIDKHNHVFGVHILLQVITVIYHVLSQISLTHIFKYFGPLDMLMYFMGLFQHVLPILVVVYSGARLRTHLTASLSIANGAVVTIQNLERVEVVYEIFMKQIKDRPQLISAAGFFVMDYPVIFNLFNFITLCIISIIELTKHWFDDYH